MHDASGVDASGLDAGIPDTGTLSCQQADYSYGSARANDIVLRELSTCARDTECALWQPTLTCSGHVHLLDCQQATRDVNAAVMRNAELAAPVCARIEPLCSIGVSCPTVAPRCVDGVCRAAMPGDAG